MEYVAKGKSWILSDDERPKLTGWLTINRACNLKCVWCYAKMLWYHQHTMTLGVARESIKMMKELGLNSVIIIGGEPTIHPNFLEIVKLIREFGMNAYLVTNALKFADNDFLQASIDAGISSVTVSFKASNREVFLKDTGVDKFDDSIKAIKNLVASSIHHVVNITACENLIKNFDEMIEAVKSTGTEKFSIDTGKPIFLDGKSCVTGMNTPKEIADFFIKVYPKLEACGLRFSVKVAIPFCLFPQAFVEKMLADGNILTGCQMVSARGMIVDPLGRILPCNHICDQFIGKIGEDFSTADEFRAFRRNEDMLDFYSVVSGHPDSLCSECPYWGLCGAGCKLYWLHYTADDLLGNFQKPKQKEEIDITHQEKIHHPTDV
jgi:radical SAM protein with 4Fe4S-binding SPASM domain